MLINDNQYLSVIDNLKSEIQKSQYSAALAVSDNWAAAHECVQVGTTVFYDFSQIASVDNGIKRVYNYGIVAIIPL